MKKTLILTVMLTSICVTSVFANYSPSDKYKKSSGSYSTTYTKPKSTTTNPTGEDSKKTQLDTIAKQMLKAGENHQDITPYQKKFMQMGVTEICSPQIISKRTPKCPPIKIDVNGRTLSGSKCAVTCYKYNNKQYDVGYCK